MRSHRSRCASHGPRHFRSLARAQAFPAGPGGPKNPRAPEKSARSARLPTPRLYATRSLAIGARRLLSGARRAASFAALAVPKHRGSAFAAGFAHRHGGALRPPPPPERRSAPPHMQRAVRALCLILLHGSKPSPRAFRGQSAALEGALRPLRGSPVENANAAKNAARFPPARG